MDENKKQEQLVETTDYLEAIDAMRSMKNLMFFAAVIGLLLLQCAFWLVHLGHVEMPAANGDNICVDSKLNISASVVRLPFIQLSVPAAAIDESNTPTLKEKIAQIAGKITGEPNAPAEPNKADVKTDVNKPLIPVKTIKIKYRHIVIAVKILNFVVLLCTVTYTAILGMILKVSLVSRLGGISHITRAVFLGLLAVVLILPWQAAFNGVLVGAIWLPGELLASVRAVDTNEMAARIMVYLRFTGYSLLALLVLVFSQLRAARWSAASLRRLGIAE